MLRHAIFPAEIFTEQPLCSPRENVGRALRERTRLPKVGLPRRYFDQSKASELLTSVANQSKFLNAKRVARNGGPIPTSSRRAKAVVPTWLILEFEG